MSSDDRPEDLPAGVQPDAETVRGDQRTGEAADARSLWGDTVADDASIAASIKSHAARTLSFS